MKGAITAFCIIGALCCLFFGNPATRVLRAVATFGMLILLLILCSGCSDAIDNYDKEAQKEFFFECLQKLPVGVGSKAVEECSSSSISWGMYKAREKNKKKAQVAP